MTEFLAFLVVLLSPMGVMLISADNVTSTESSSSDPALLAHVYDTHANLRHHHHNHPWGPHFEENPVNVTVREGENTHLDCRVGLIEDKMVSWVRRKSEQLDLLTLGTKNHSSDPRFLSEFKYPNNWRLAIRNASRSDSGVYLCQISTHPPKVLQVHLTVEAPEVFIVNSRLERIHEVHYKEGSTLSLTCLGTNGTESLKELTQADVAHDIRAIYTTVTTNSTGTFIRVEFHFLGKIRILNNVKSRSVSWFRNADLLNHDVSRGGVSIKTDMTADHAKSILHVAWVTRKDGGTYLCSAPPQNATITVHVLNGENPAELYHNEAMASLWSWKCFLLIFVLWVSR